jgi:hypothetical protein
MFNRRRLRRERLEIYLVYLIMAYRPLILITGLVILAYASLTMFTHFLAGSLILVPAIFLLVLYHSYNIVLFTARLLAWLGTLWGNED